MPDRAQLSLGILAGGAARRLGGIDKAFAQFDGQALLDRTLVALGTGYGQTLISYNGSDCRINSYSATVVADQRAGYPGPLAGLEAMLQLASCAWLMTVPVDLQDFPANLPDQLFERIGQPTAGIAVCDADGLQPLVAIWPVAAARLAVSRALDAGSRAVHPLLESLQMPAFDISPRRFGNLNSPDDFR